MSEHEEFLPPVPTESPNNKHMSNLPPLPPDLTEDALNKHNEIIETFREHKEVVMNESKRILNEVQESEKLVDLEQKDLEMKSEHHSSVQEESELLEDIRTLSSLIAFLLAKEELPEQHIVINHDVKKVLYQLLSVDVFFDDVEKLLKEIIHDNKIDANDVPQLMVLTLRLYEILKSSELSFDLELCGTVLKTIFHLAIHEKLIPIHDEELKLLNCLFDIVDMSIRLLEIQTTDKKKKGILRSFMKLFHICK